jgi:hypothetical protein
MVSKNLDNFWKGTYQSKNKWGIPDTKPFSRELDLVEWVSFGEKNKIRSPEKTGIHFYIDDYKFNAIWSNPDKWIGLFKECAAVIAPDFSNYTDMPPAMQLWNCYRRQWLARYWQDAGVNVVSSLSWGLGQIREWTFAGIPKKTSCATSFSCDGIDKEMALQEFLTVVKKLKPFRLYVKCGKRDAEVLSRHVAFERIEVYRSKRARE